MIAVITLRFSTATSGRIPGRIISKRRIPSPLNSNARSLITALNTEPQSVIYFSKLGSLFPGNARWCTMPKYVLALPSSPNAAYTSASIKYTSEMRI